MDDRSATTRAVPSLYPALRRILFGLQPESAHDLVIGTLEKAPPFARRAMRASFAIDDERLRTRVLGLELPNPVGLAAGFDKSGRAYEVLATLGFGFVEIGTITARAQPGNPRPRVFRLPRDGALLNRMGFNNPGAPAVAARLSRTPSTTVLGINIGKSKVVPVEEAIGDYLLSVDQLLPFARYLVVNVSSPNTPGLRELQEAEPLRALLAAIVDRVRKSASTAPAPPVLVKLAPDLTDAQLDEAVDVAVEAGAAGFIAVNTTLSRSGLTTPAPQIEALGAGGISGRPIRARAQEIVTRIYQRTEGRFPIIGVGGIFSAADAWDRICAGASLVQLYTGLIYEGPGLVRQINQGLIQRLEASGHDSIASAVGSSLRTH